ncbi:MAG TPA: hypothetical protein VKF80_02505 [Candidatus Eisenbacteria bacterium]|nr:hypothetical protein [Candidatus Eisenbacteria bacterium]
MQSVVVFAAGYLLGARAGAVVGGLAMGLYSLANPYGLAHPAVFASQVVGRAFVGLTGGWAAKLGLPRSASARAAVLVAWAAAGAAFYDTLTNVATGFAFGAVLPSLVMGMPWALAHLLSNAAVYAVVGVPLTTALDARRAALVACLALALLVTVSSHATAQDSTQTFVPDTVLRILPDTTKHIVAPPPPVVPRLGPPRWAIETNAQERLRHAPLGTDDAWSAVGAGPRFYEDKGDVEPLVFAGFPSVVLGGVGDVAAQAARSTPWQEAGAVPGGAREATGWTPTSFGSSDTSSELGWSIPSELPGWGARGSYGAASEPRTGQIASSAAWLGIGRETRTEQGFLLDAGRTFLGTDAGILWTAWTRASDPLGELGNQGEHALQVRVHARSPRASFVVTHESHRVAIEDFDKFEHESRGSERTAFQTGWASPGGGLFVRVAGEHVEQHLQSNGFILDLLLQKTRENSAGVVVGTRRGAWTGELQGGWWKERLRRSIGVQGFAPADVEVWRGGASARGPWAGGHLEGGVGLENALGGWRALPSASWLKDVGQGLRLDLRASAASAPIHVEGGALDASAHPESVVTRGWTASIGVRYADPEVELSPGDTASVRSAPGPRPSRPFSGRLALVGWTLTDQPFDAFALFARDLLDGETVIANAKGAALVGAFEWWPREWITLGGNGYAAAREIPAGVAVPTPDYRWIGWAGPRVMLFRGSLDLQILGELEVVGPRAASDENFPTFVRPGARAVLGFGSAWIVVRGVDLDDVRHPLPGRSAGGERLLSPGREIRAFLEWRFRN